MRTRSSYKCQLSEMVIPNVPYYPGTTFFAGTLPGWWEYWERHNLRISFQVGLHAVALVWEGGQLWKCLSGLPFFFTLNLAHVDQLSTRSHHTAAHSCLVFVNRSLLGRARIGLPQRASAASDHLDPGHGKRSSRCSICPPNPGGQHGCIWMHNHVKL